jgi:hypothetical protein
MEKLMPEVIGWQLLVVTLILAKMIFSLRPAPVRGIKRGTVQR